MRLNNHLWPLDKSYQTGTKQKAKKINLLT